MRDQRVSDASEPHILGLAHINACARSTVGVELALRPGFSAQARMPPTALLVPRGGRHGLLVLTAGLVQYFSRRYTTGSVVASLFDGPRGLAPLVPCGPNKGTGRPTNP